MILKGKPRAAWHLDGWPMQHPKAVAIPSSALTRLFNLLLVFCFLTGISIGTASAERTPFALTQPKLRKIIRRCLKTGDISVRKPELVIIGRLYGYHHGGMTQAVVDPELFSRKPLDFPMQAQVEVELIKKAAFARQHKRLWRPYLRQAEIHIGQELALIGEYASKKPPAKRNKAMWHRLKAINRQIRRILFRPVALLAEQKRLLPRWPQNGEKIPPARWLALNHHQLRKAVLIGLGSRKFGVHEPEISISNDGRYYTYKAGGLTQPLFDHWTPIDILLDAQVSVELIRKSGFFQGQEELWEPYLRRVENLVARDLAWIAKGRRTKHESQTIGQPRSEGGPSPSHQILARGVFTVMKRKGISPKPPRQKPASAPHRKYPLTVKTNPPGGAVFYLTVAAHQAADAAGILKKRRTWHEASGQKHELSGNYIFKVKWPDGRSRTTGKIKIEGETTITFTPDGVRFSNQEPNDD
jgi:hypothetical protein